VYEEIDDTLQVISIETEWQMVALYQLLYISLTLVYEEIDDTLQVISIETEWQMVSHYQLLYISLY
jgi:hypothetical protein